MHMSKLNLDFKNKQLIALLIFIVFTIAIICIDYFALQIPIVAAGSIVILEAILAALLHKVPVWFHGIVAIALLVAGVCCNKTIFMLIMAIFYIGCMALFFAWHAFRQK